MVCLEQGQTRRPGEWLSNPLVATLSLTRPRWHELLGVEYRPIWPLLHRLDHDSFVLIDTKAFGAQEEATRSPRLQVFRHRRAVLPEVHTQRHNTWPPTEHRQHINHMMKDPYSMASRRDGEGSMLARSQSCDWTLVENYVVKRIGTAELLLSQYRNRSCWPSNWERIHQGHLLCAHRATNEEIKYQNCGKRACGEPNVAREHVR